MLRTIRYVAWATIAVLIAVAGFAAVGFRANFPDSASLPFAAPIGGPFDLTAQDGTRFSSRNLAGKPYALFFGYTNCPDVCPTTLLELTNAFAELGPDAGKMKVVYITVDPERDTPEFLAKYMTSFDKRFTALTGTTEEISEVARKFRAIYRRVPSKDGYTMDHTATVYLMDAKGALAGTLTYNEEFKTQVAKLKRLVAG